MSQMLTVLTFVFGILIADVLSYNHIKVPGSGCSDGSQIGLYGHEKIATCQGQWKGHINNASNLCAVGWQVCSYQDSDLLRTVSWEEAISVQGCYAINAAQDGGKCQKCMEDYGQDDMAGIGRGCPYQHFEETSCIRGGRIDSSCCVDSHFHQACHYKPHINGVVCCKMPTRKPKIVVKPKERIEVNTGLIFLLTCQATGSPQPRIQWYKDGTQISKTNTRIQTLSSGDLLVTLARKSDTGLYSCEVINSEGIDMASSQVIVREYSSGCQDGTTEGLELHRDVHACAGKWEGHVRKGKSLCKKGWRVCNPSDKNILHELKWLDMLDLDGCYAYNAAVRKGDCKKCREKNMAGFGRTCGRLRYHTKRQSCLATGRVDVYKRSESSSGCFYKEGVTTGVLCCKRKSRKSKKKTSALCSAKCLNGGKCKGPNFCQCPSGYKGAVCQIPICRHGCGDFGECVKPGVCQCKEGFAGKNCHIKVCKQNCLNGGRCMNNKCRCPSAYYGKHCQKKSLVSSSLNRTER